MFVKHGLKRSTLICFVFLAFPAGDSAVAQFSNLFGRGPAVEEIKTPELAKLLRIDKERVQAARESGQKPTPANFVLVDVRSEDEVRVSVIPGAITKSEFEKNRSTYNGRMVIPYCTIGGRSGAYAKQLAKDGVKVKNYKGSILDWVENELPVVTLEGMPTNRVHTYSDRYRIPAKYEQVTK